MDQTEWKDDTDQDSKRSASADIRRNFIKWLKTGTGDKIICFLSADANYLPDWMNIDGLVGMFADFYADFDRKKAEEMLKQLNLREKDRLKTLSKGNKEKVQLILAMSRKAEIYFLDEPIGGVDPAARDYILNTIIRNYSEDALVVMSTHLIADIERVIRRSSIYQSRKRCFSSQCR